MSGRFRARSVELRQLMDDIEQRRAATGRSLKDVCQKMDRATYFRWRRGSNEPKVGHLAEVVRDLGGRLKIVWDD